MTILKIALAFWKIAGAIQKIVCDDSEDRTWRCKHRNRRSRQQGPVREGEGTIIIISSCWRFKMHHQLCHESKDSWNRVCDLINWCNRAGDWMLNIMHHDVVASFIYPCSRFVVDWFIANLWMYYKCKCVWLCMLGGVCATSLVICVMACHEDWLYQQCMSSCCWIMEFKHA